MQVEFCGAAGEVTGSCHRVTTRAGSVLLDCGQIQGSPESERRNAEPFPFDARRIDALVLSHAHIDHIGRVPLLVRRGFRGPIHTHPATADLARIMLEDAVALAEADLERENRERMRRGRRPLPPLYTREDVREALKRMQPLPYGETREILQGVRLTLHDAGHILGSAAVELVADEDGAARRLVYSGDLGPRGTPILCDPAPIERADLVLLESTYGNRLHRSREDTLVELAGIIAAAAAGGGNVVIPAFAVGRTQELLYWFAQHFEAWNLARFRIFLDSPMATKVVEVYEGHEDLFDAEARALWRARPHPLRLPNLSFTDSVAESQAINEFKGGAIIIAGSGMCNGGRIRHHLRQNLGRRDAHIVFVGYQAEGTLGRRLVNGVRQVKLFGEWISVNAARHTVGGLSAHADQAGLLQWYGGIRAGAGSGRPPVCLVHGEDIAREPLAQCLRERYGARVELARPGMQLTV